MRMRSIALSAALLCASTAVFAQAPAKPRKFYVGVQVGQSELDRENSELSGDFDDHDVAYTLLAGFRFSRFYALEFGYTDLGEFSAEFRNSCTPVPGLPCPPDIGKTAIESFFLNNIVVWPIADHFHLKAVLGMNWHDLSGSLARANGSTTTFSDSSGSYNFGLGIGVPVNPQLELGLDVTVYRALKFEYGFSGAIDLVYEPDATLAMLGVRYRF
jgi:OmpA-OmpF porin, OOP family